MQINAIDGVCFSVFQSTQFAVGRVAGITVAADDFAAQFFKAVLDFIFLVHICGIQLVVILERAVRNAAQRCEERQRLWPVVMFSWWFVPFQIFHKKESTETKSPCLISP